MEKTNKYHYNIALDRFMEEQCNHLTNLLNIDRNLYYNSDDKKFILCELLPEDAERIWKEIIVRINQRQYSGFAKGIFPFCLISSDQCSKCVYRENHNGFDDIEFIMNVIKENNIPLEDILNHMWYRKTIEQIQNQLEKECNND